MEAPKAEVAAAPANETTPCAGESPRRRPHLHPLFLPERASAGDPPLAGFPFSWRSDAYGANSLANKLKKAGIPPIRSPCHGQGNIVARACGSLFVARCGRIIARQTEG